MDKGSLEIWLQQGLSLEQIGMRVGRDASTVGYWVKKHGLKAAHREKHAPRGVVTQERLEHLVAAGHSVRSIAQKFGVGTGTVRHWLKKFGLKTRGMSNRRATRHGREAGRATIQLICRRHGPTDFWLEGRGSYRCLKCRQEAVARRRRKVKEILVQEAGGKCCVCGYDKYPGALQFHHLDPETKSFGLGFRGLTKSIEVLREEAAKCVLLCATCHAEVEAGVSTLS